MSEKRPRFFSAIAMLLIVATLLVWWVNALTNEDPLWFLRSFRAKADWVVVYWDGTTTMFFPGDPAYEAILAAFSDGVAHWSGYEGSVGLSDESLELYRTQQRMLEVHFNDPVHVHSRHLYPEARCFFVPLSGTHADWRRVFAGLTDKPRIGVLNMSETRFSALLDAVQTAIGPGASS